MTTDLDVTDALRLSVAADLASNAGMPMPTIVCLCGSTRFWREFQRAGLSETMAGRIVLSIGAASGTDDEHFGNLPREEYDRVKEMLDELHKRKIDLADEILVLNVGGYIGESTKSEIEYARDHDKTIRWLEPVEMSQPSGPPRTDGGNDPFYGEIEVKQLTEG